MNSNKRTLAVQLGMLALPLLAMLAPIRSIASGHIVVAHDDLILADPGFHEPADPAVFAGNVADWFTGGRPGRFLAYTDNQALTGTLLIGAMTSRGHTWVVSTTTSMTMTNLATFDGVFLCGRGVPDEQELINYVNAGGNVYVAAEGVVADDMIRWNPFLHHFGLGFANQATANLDFPITSNHPLLAGVDHLYGVNGTAVVDLQPANPFNRVIATTGSSGLFAIWGREKSPIRIRVSEVELCWDGASNVNYRFEYRSALTTNAWVRFGTNCYAGQDSVICVYDPVRLDEPQKFYRVVTNCFELP